MQQNINLTKEHNEVDVYDCNTNDVRSEEEDNTIEERVKEDVSFDNNL
jgi:hypothetical protein